MINYIISELRGFYPEEELRELAYWIIEESTGMTRTQILTDCKDTQNISNMEIILQKLRAHEPIQYIFGHTEWMGLDLRVTPATLIPRPETAELVEWILQVGDRDKPLKVLDIGTGSGCIAIALKKAAPHWQVTGLDISEEALAVAKENATRNKVEVNWLQADILSPIANSSLPIADIIVSNPPYVTESEKAFMRSNVLDHEPHLALFVPDDDPLLFYRAVAQWTLQLLKPGGFGIVEINEALGEDTAEIYRRYGFSAVTIIKDLNDKDRFVSFRR